MASAKSLKGLYQVQKQCIGTIHKKSKGTNVDDLIKMGGYLMVYTLTQLELCKLGYKVTHRQIPGPLCDIFNKHGGKNPITIKPEVKKTTNIQKHHSVKFNKSFLCKSVILYTKLPQSLKSKPTLKSFTYCTKKHILC